MRKILVLLVLLVFILAPDSALAFGRKRKKNPPPPPLPIPASGHEPGYWENRALEISARIQSHHMPFKSVVDPLFASRDNDDELIRYTRGGDSALWTGHYLAAEAFRFATTHSDDALQNVRRTVKGIRALVDASGTGVLARVVVPVGADPTLQAIIAEEGRTRTGTICDPESGECQDVQWVGSTTRDQYAGVFFGLSVTHDLVPDPFVQEQVRYSVKRMVDFLRDHNWVIVMPGETLNENVFITHQHFISSILSTAHKVDRSNYGVAYALSRKPFLAETHLRLESLEPNASYFKFNLSHDYMYSLVKDESNVIYRDLWMKAFDQVRNGVRTHGNAYFNMIDRALRGPDQTRDHETVDILREVLKRPKRDLALEDLSGNYEQCDYNGQKYACSPVPIAERPPTDYLWQRSPFDLPRGGQSGNIEANGIDFILPYWMGRYHGVIPAEY